MKYRIYYEDWRTKEHPVSYEIIEAESEKAAHDEFTKRHWGKLQYAKTIKTEAIAE